MSEDRLLRVVGELYDAATDPARLPAVGGLIAGEVGAASSLMFTARSPSAELVELISASDNFDARARADYRDYYSYRNEWFLRGARRRPPYIARGGELIGYGDFDRTEFCNDWCARVGIYHLLAATFPVEGDVIGAIGIHRDRAREGFDDEEKRLLAAVTPHLMRMVQIAHKLGTFRRAAGLTLEVLHGLAVGLVLLDGECRTLFANAVAERVIRSGRWLAHGGGRLRPVSRRSAAAFDRAVGQACGTSAGTGLAAGGVVRLIDRSAQALAVLIAPFRSVGLDLGAMQPAAAIVFADAELQAAPSARALAAALGLTPAEARLVAALAAGGTLAGYARVARRISLHTAKAQLRAVFLKTGYSRQADLIAAVLADPALMLRPAAGGEAG